LGPLEASTLGGKMSSSYGTVRMTKGHMPSNIIKTPTTVV